MEYSDKITNEYDKEPVYYCERCMSLAIVGKGTDCYCNNCLSTRIRRTNIYRWIEMSKINTNIADKSKLLSQYSSKLKK